MIVIFTGSVKVEIRIMPKAHERWKILEDIFYACQHSCIPVRDFFILEFPLLYANWDIDILSNDRYVLAHIYRYERKFVEESKLKQIAQTEEDKVSQTLSVGSEVIGANLKSKTSISEQDLDSYLLGDDLDDSHGNPGKFNNIFFFFALLYYSYSICLDLHFAQF